MVPSVETEARANMAFVERRFASPRGEVLARFGSPYLAPGGEYRCRWHIIWPDHERSLEAAGIDGLQALMLAMRTVHSELTESDEYKAGTLTYLDQTDLDLPPTWGRGSLYDAGPPPEGLSGS
jgi:hypothetical protein